MKKSILLMAVFAIIASCTKKTDEIKKPEQELSSDIKLVVKGAAQEFKPLYKGSETYSFLGFGYDVTDKFNDEASIRASVVDIATYDAGGSSHVNLLSYTEASFSNFQAENALDLSGKFSNSFEETVGLKLFGNTVEKTFPETVVTDKKYVYGYHSNYVVRKRYLLYYGPFINNYLAAGFKRDVTLLSPQELVHKYGTHVLAVIKLGSKFDVVYQAEAPEEKRKYIVMEGFRYALQRTFGLMSGDLDEVNLRNLNANSSAKIYYSSIGGDISKLKPEILNNKLVLNLENWRSSATEEKARFIGVYENGLIPLDRFIDESGKKAEVKSYLEKYFAAKSVKLTN